MPLKVSCAHRWRFEKLDHGSETPDESTDWFNPGLDVGNGFVKEGSPTLGVGGIVQLA